MISTKVEFMQGRYFDFRRTPHIAISGQTGTGKSMMMIYFIYKFLTMNAEIYIIDTKMGDLFKISQHILPAQNKLLPVKNPETPQEILICLERCVYLMDIRQEQILKQNKIGADFTDLNIPPVWLCIDELNATVALLDKKEREEFYRLLTLIILKGRSAGVNVMIGSQQLNATIWPSSLRDQMGFRIFLANSDTPAIATAKEMLFGKIENYPRKREGFGGWYMLESESADVQIFESPNMQGFSVEKHLLTLL